MDQSCARAGARGWDPSESEVVTLVVARQARARQLLVHMQMMHSTSAYLRFTCDVYSSLD